MPLDIDKVHFPMNVVNLLAVAIKDIDPDVGNPNDQDYVEGLRVFKRPLDPTDGTESVGIFPQTVNPIPESKEMGFNRSPVEPLITRYSIGIQALIIEAKEEDGIAKHSLLANELRHILYRDRDLIEVLSTISILHQPGGPRETVKKWDIPRQSFFSSELSGQFAFLSNLEFEFETTLN